MVQQQYFQRIRFGAAACDSDSSSTGYCGGCSGDSCRCGRAILSGAACTVRTFTGELHAEIFSADSIWCGCVMMVAAAAQDTAGESAVVAAASGAADVLSGAADAVRIFTGELPDAATTFSGFDIVQLRVTVTAAAQDIAEGQW